MLMLSKSRTARRSVHNINRRRMFPGLAGIIDYVYTIIRRLTTTAAGTHFDLEFEIFNIPLRLTVNMKLCITMKQEDENGRQRQ